MSTSDEPREVVCAATGKARHPDRPAARAALAKARSDADERRHRKTPRAIYRCPLCEGYHLTSQSRRQYLMWPGRTRRHA